MDVGLNRDGEKFMGRTKTNDVEDEDDGSHCALCTAFNKQPCFEKW
jgi:hypothetical protein